MSHHIQLRHLRHLPATTLLEETSRLAKDEKELTVKVIAHLGEIARRRLHLDQGFSGLFDYCTRGLGFSEGSSWLRVQVANKCITCPQLLCELAESTVTLSVAGTIAGILTADNCQEVLRKSRGLTKRQAEELVAVYKPKPVVKPGIRRSTKTQRRELLLKTSVKSASENNTESPAPGPIPSHHGERTLRPADADTFNIRFAASREVKQKLERLAQVLDRELQHNLCDIIDYALEVALDKRDPIRREKRRKKRKETRTRRSETGKQSQQTSPDEVVKPRDEKEKEDGWRRSRNIPAAIRDQVMERAGTQCEATGKDGRRCGCRSGLEVDHIVSFGKGGGHNIENLQALCKAHNLRKAELEYGKTMLQSRALNKKIGAEHTAFNRKSAFC